MKPGFSEFHPVTHLFFYCFAFLLSMSATHPITLFTVLLTGFIYDVRLRGRKSLSYTAKLILPIVIASSLINGFFNTAGKTVLFTMPNGSNFTLEALVFGLVLALRAAAVLLWLGSFNEIITPDEILYLFGRFSPKIALLISMSLRFIPLIVSQGEEITSAKKGIGAMLSSGSLRSRLKCASSLLSVLVSRSLEGGADTVSSMEARGYGLRGRTSCSFFRLTVKDFITIILIFAVAVMFFIAKSSLYAEYMPCIRIYTPDIIGITVSVLLTAILLIPVITDIREDRKWSASA